MNDQGHQSMHDFLAGIGKHPDKAKSKADFLEQVAKSGLSDADKAALTTGDLAAIQQQLGNKIGPCWVLV